MAPVVGRTPAAGISSPSDSLIVTSPALSASSLSSSGFDFVNVKQQLDSERLAGAGSTIAAQQAASITNTTTTPNAGEESSFSDDEIVWNVSESEDHNGGTLLSDDDFVVLSRARSPASRSRTKTPQFNSVRQDGTIRGIPLRMDSGLESENKDMVASELVNEVAKLSVSADYWLVGEASGMKTPVDAEAEPSTTEYLNKKVKKAAKVRTEEEALRQQKKKERKERIEKSAAKRLKKEKVAAEGETKKEESANINATPLAKPLPLPPVIAPSLPKNVSKATLVPSSTTTINHVTSRSSTVPVPTPPSPDTPATKSPELLKKKKKPKKGKITTTVPILLPATTSVVAEKVSEQTSNPTPYDEAVSYITSYISNPSVHNNRICHLTLLQSLIVELGLLTDTKLLPTSIKSAKQYIKTRVFLNIREYLSKRLEGPQTVKDLMFPSRSALVRDMKRKKNYASPKWVKKRGLQDLLVSVFR